MTETPEDDRPAGSGPPPVPPSGSDAPQLSTPSSPTGPAASTPQPPAAATPAPPPATPASDAPAGTPTSTPTTGTAPTTRTPPSNAADAPAPAGPSAPGDEPAADTPAAARRITPPVATAAAGTSSAPAAGAGSVVAEPDQPSAEQPDPDQADPDGSDPGPAAADEDAAPRSGRGLLVALSLLTLAGLIATVYLAVNLYQRDREEEREASALAAAETLAGYLTSYDSDSLEEDFQRVAAHATGEFAKDFEAESARVRPTIEQFKVTAEGQVREAAVQKLSSDGKMATVLLFIDQRVRTSASPDPRTDKNRIVMSVERLGGEWFISRVRVL